MNFIVKNDGRGSPLTIYRGIVIAIVMMFLITPLFQFGHNLSTALTDDVITVSGLNNGSNAESKISKAIVRAMIYENETKSEDIEYLVDNWKNININSTEGGVLGFSDTYKYSLNFFMLIILGIITIFLLFFVAIQMSKRVMEIALFKIIAPFCCTSLTNNGKAFETWCKSTIGLFAITVVQFVSIGLMLNMFSSAFEDNGTMTGIFLVIGSLLFIIGTPTIINSLLGQQSGMMSAFGDMQSLMAIGHASSQGLGIAKAGTMQALSMGADVIHKGSNTISGGANKISNMLNRGNNLTSEQKETFKNLLTIDHNNYKAKSQLNNFLGENSKMSSNAPPIQSPFNVQHPIIQNHQLNIFKDSNKSGGND